MTEEQFKDAALVFVGARKSRCATLPDEIRLWDANQGAEFVVGRCTSKCNVVVSSPKLPSFVSSQHARFIFRHGAWNVKDLGSTNKLYVNKVLVQDAVLKEGDKIAFGPPVNDQRQSVAESEGNGGFVYEFKILTRKRPSAVFAKDGQSSPKVSRSAQQQATNFTQRSVKLTEGAVERISSADEQCQGSWTVQVLDCHLVAQLKRWRMTLSDGANKASCLAASDLNSRFEEGSVVATSVINVLQFGALTKKRGSPPLISALEVVNGACPIIGSPMSLKAQKEAAPDSSPNSGSADAHAKGTSAAESECEVMLGTPVAKNRTSGTKRACEEALSPVGKRKRVELPRSHSEVLEWFRETLETGSYKISGADCKKFLANVESESIDAEVILTLTESDLQSFGLNLGNRRKLLQQIKEAYALRETPTQARVRLSPECAHHESKQAERHQGEGAQDAGEAGEESDEADDSPILCRPSLQSSSSGGTTAAMGAAVSGTKAAGSTEEDLHKELALGDAVLEEVAEAMKKSASAAVATERPQSREERGQSDLETQPYAGKVHPAQDPMANAAKAADEREEGTGKAAGRPVGAGTTGESWAGARTFGDRTVSAKSPTGAEGGQRALRDKGRSRPEQELETGDWWGVGKLVEAWFEGDWWQAKVMDVRAGAENANEVMIRYVGGAEEEDEWVSVGGPRVRAPTDSWNEDVCKTVKRNGAERGLSAGAYKTRSAQFQLGDHVRAKYKNGMWYGATITAREGDKFVLKWDDGDARDKVKQRQDLRHEYADAKFQIGDLVEGLYKDGVWYNAEVVEWDGHRYKLRWEDGDTSDTIKTEKELRERECSSFPKGAESRLLDSRAHQEGRSGRQPTTLNCKGNSGSGSDEEDDIPLAHRKAACKAVKDSANPSPSASAKEALESSVGGAANEPQAPQADTLGRDDTESETLRAEATQTLRETSAGGSAAPRADLHAQEQPDAEGSAEQAGGAAGFSAGSSTRPTGWSQGSADGGAATAAEEGDADADAAGLDAEAEQEAQPAGEAAARQHSGRQETDEDSEHWADHDADRDGLGKGEGGRREGGREGRGINCGANGPGETVSQMDGSCEDSHAHAEEGFEDCSASVEY